MDIDKTTPALPTGHQYNSVEELLKGEGASAEFRSKVANISSETCLVDCLISMRLQAKLKQEDIAKILNVGQSAISKLESKRDADLTISEVSAYARATKNHLTLDFGKRMKHVEAVQYHAFCIKDKLQSLAALAQENEELESEIRIFFGEALLNILSILEKCQSQLPTGGDFELGIHVANRKRQLRNSPISNNKNSLKEVAL